MDVVAVVHRVEAVATAVQLADHVVDISAHMPAHNTHTQTSSYKAQVIPPPDHPSSASHCGCNGCDDSQNKARTVIEPWPRPQGTEACWRLKQAR